jgi:hypothetical protein
MDEVKGGILWDWWTGHDSNQFFRDHFYLGMHKLNYLKTALNYIVNLFTEEEIHPCVVVMEPLPNKEYVEPAQSSGF